MGVRMVTGAVALGLALLTAPAAVADSGDTTTVVADTASVAVAAGPAAGPTAPPNGTPHLPSPENLPPGTTTTEDVPQNRTLNYLRDLFHAVRTQDVTMGDALILFAQRPMDTKAPVQAMSPRPAPGADPAPAAPSDTADAPAAEISVAAADAH